MDDFQKKCQNELAVDISVPLTTILQNSQDPNYGCIDEVSTHIRDARNKIFVKLALFANKPECVM